MFATTAITTMMKSTKIMLPIVFALQKIRVFIAAAHICQD